MLLTAGDFPLHSGDMDVLRLLNRSSRGWGKRFLRQCADFETDCHANLVAFHFRIRCLTSCQEQCLPLTQCQTYLWQHLGLIATSSAGSPLSPVYSFPYWAPPHQQAEVRRLTGGNQMCSSVSTHRNTVPHPMPSRKGLLANLPPQYWQLSPGKQG